MACWQIIFRIKNDDGIVRDYCREQPPMIDGPFGPNGEWDIRERTETEARDWAEAQRLKHSLHSFEMQYW